MGPAADGPVFDHINVDDSVTEDIMIQPHLKVLRDVCRISLIVYGASDPYVYPGGVELAYSVRA
ncbi:MAG: hypothetical protein NVSMB64_05340 [Candidatus Velthaea sp.]